MKKIYLLLAVVALASCSTMKVATNVIKEYPASVQPQDVVVYMPGDPMPPQVEELGTVTVYDDGSAKKEPLDSTMFRAKKAVSETGGNGLQVLELRTPAESGSTNYQVYGSMLLTQGEIEPIVIEIKEDEDEAHDDSDARQAYTDFARVKEIQNAIAPKAVASGHNAYIGGGYMRILTKFNTDETSTITKGNINNAANYYAGYEYLTQKGFGFGVAVDRLGFGCYESIVSEGVTYNVKDSFNVTGYMGSFSYFYSEGNVIFGSRFGFGYATCRQILKVISPGSGSMLFSNDGLCMKLSAEILYRITDTVCLGGVIGDDQYSFITGDGRESLQGSFESYGIGIILRASF